MYPAFVSAIHSLLTASRSHAPICVLTHMKSVVSQTRLFERYPQSERSDVDRHVLKSTRERAEATLSNVVPVSKTHATSSGMSPVSLLDTAATHISATVTEIGKTVYIWKSSRAEQDDFNTSLTPPPNTPALNGFSRSLCFVEEMIKPIFRILMD